MNNSNNISNNIGLNNYYIGDIEPEDNDCKSNVHIIDSIISKRNNEYEGDTEYLVKWKNSSLENTWETLENLLYSRCFQLIFDYEESHNDLQRNPDVLEFFRVFSEFNVNSSSYYEKNIGKFGNFPKDKLLKILDYKENVGNGDKYFLIEWEQRMDGFKPLNSFINSKIISVFETDYYIKYLEEKIYY